MRTGFFHTLMNFRKSARKDKPEETDETDEMDEMNEMDENERARRKELKELYVGHRDEFRNNAKAMEELVAWQDRKTDYDYTVIRNGLIPSKILEKPSDFKQTFVKCDTWFSEFLTHNPKKLILSESKLSYIIGNLASYDRRQYPAWFLHPDDPSKAIQIPSSPASPDPDGLFSPSDERKRSANGPFSPEQPTGASESKGSGSDNTTTEGKSHGKDITPEGQAFGHCLVIPKRRIFNIVDPIAVENHCKPIRELREHFIKFWNTKGGPEVILQRTRDGFDEQNKKLHAKIKSTPIPSSSSSSMTRQRTKEFAAKREAQLDSLMGDLEAAYHDMATQFLKLRAPQDFVFGFHPFPQNSVGHLHLHVYPRKDELREWSSKAHESKTVEIEEVLEAEGETLNGDTGR